MSGGAGGQIVNEILVREQLAIYTDMIVIAESKKLSADRIKGLRDEAKLLQSLLDKCKSRKELDETDNEGKEPEARCICDW